MYQPKILIKALCFILFALLFSCHENSDKASIQRQPKSNTIAIRGNIKGLNTSWVYLHNLYPIDGPPIDSAQVINDSFVFNFHPDTVYEPHLAYITTKDGKLSLNVIDPYTPKGGEEHRYHEFIMETGITELTGDLAKARGITLKAGPQNKFRFQHQTLPFAGISRDAGKHKMQVDQFISDVNEQPDAYYAMFALENLKFRVDKNELTQMFNAFDKETREAYSGRLIKVFLDNKPDDNALAPNDLLTDSKGRPTNMIDTTKKLNMVVFWASWCGPCKLEIPTLKKIAAKYKGDNFRIVSVSIDKDKEQWKEMLPKQNMEWQQLCIANNDILKVISQYNLGSIPQVYFIDNKRKILKQVGDYDPANDAVFDKTISDFLKTD